MSFSRKLFGPLAGLALVAMISGSYAPAASADTRTSLDRATVSVTVTWNQYDSVTGRTISTEEDVRGTGTFVGSDVMLTSSTLFDPESWLVRDKLDAAWNDDNGGSPSKSRRQAEASGELDQPVIEAVANTDGTVEYGIGLKSAQYKDGIKYDHIDLLSPDVTTSGDQLDAEYAKARKSHLAVLKVNGVKVKHPLQMMKGDTAKAGNTVRAYYYGPSGSTRSDQSFSVNGSAGSGLLDLGNTSGLPYTAAGGPIMSSGDNLVGILTETSSDARTIYGLSSKALEAYLYDINITPVEASDKPTSGTSDEPSASTEPSNGPSASAEPSDKPIGPVESTEPTTEPTTQAEPTDNSTSESTYEPPAKVHQPSAFGTFVGNLWQFFLLAPLKGKLLMLLLLLAIPGGILIAIEKLRGKKAVTEESDSAPADDDTEVAAEDPTDDTIVEEDVDQSLVDTLVLPRLGEDGHPINDGVDNPDNDEDQKV